MEAANTLFGKVIDLVFGVVKQEIDYIRNCSENVNKLREGTQNLKDMKGVVQQRIDVANGKGDHLLDGVIKWINKAETEISTAEKLIEEEANAKKTCFNSRLCLNLGTLHHYSKMAASTTRLLLEMKENGKTYENCVSIPAPTPSIVHLYERKNLDKIDTQKLTFREIMEALSDESIQLVGVYGLGGVGKTTLAKEVAAEVKNQFEDIVFITVSQIIDAKVIQEKVQVAAKRIIKGDKVLIILDDIWEEIVLSDVGIPCWKDYKNCKILFTSRNKHVCETMNVQRNICVKTLKEDESWILFKHVVGERLDTDGSLKEIAPAVVKECGGLPLIIQVIGKALRSKPTHLWEAALDRLRNHAPLDIDQQIRKAFTHLKLSYDYLESEEARSCFLLCSMFPEDHNIYLKELVNYGVGLQIFKNLGSFDDARKRVEIAVDILKSSFLLLCEQEGTVRMHDVVRDVGLLIASDNFFVKAGKGLREWPHALINNTSESYTKMSLMNNRISKLHDDQELHFPLVDTFLIQDNEVSIVSDGFFGGLREVKVLDMSSNDISSLPHSIKLLTKLRMLDLSGNGNLHEISMLGELKEVEILRLRFTGIKTIPEEIGRLNKLRLLDVKHCPKLHDIAPCVISRLTCLEELYISFYGKYLVELKELKSFKTLHLRLQYPLPHCLQGVQLLQYLESLEALTGFSIRHGRRNSPFKSIQKSHIKRRVYIEEVSNTTMPFMKKLVQVSNAIILSEIQGLYNIIPGTYEQESSHGLKSISLLSCPDVSCLVKTNDGTIGERKPMEMFFSHVEEITLNDLNRLELLWDCPHKYISLRNLQRIQISYCNSLKTLFPATVAQGLVNLGEINITVCKKLEAVISANDVNATRGEIEQTDCTETDVDLIFPRLTKITLVGLNKLESFYSGHSTIRYPSLERICFEKCYGMRRWGYGIQDIPKINFHRQGTECSINDILLHLKTRGNASYIWSSEGCI
ncbi:hypothetical protein LXL04_014773 [Taraxacum kok-saghyz]